LRRVRAGFFNKVAFCFSWWHALGVGGCGVKSNSESNCQIGLWRRMLVRVSCWLAGQRSRVRPCWPRSVIIGQLLASNELNCNLIVNFYSTFINILYGPGR
jgi:hypothetical protein